MHKFTFWIIFTVLIPVQAIGLEFTVNTSADLVDANPGDGICEAAAAHGDCTLRAAIMETNQLVGSDEITIPPSLSFARCEIAHF